METKSRVFGKASDEFLVSEYLRKNAQPEDVISKIWPSQKSVVPQLPKNRQNGLKGYNVSSRIPEVNYPDAYTKAVENNRLKLAEELGLDISKNFDKTLQNYYNSNNKADKEKNKNQLVKYRDGLERYRDVLDNDEAVDALIKTVNEIVQRENSINVSIRDMEKAKKEYENDDTYNTVEKVFNLIVGRSNQTGAYESYAQKKAVVFQNLESDKNGSKIGKELSGLIKNYTKSSKQAELKLKSIDDVVGAIITNGGKESPKKHDYGIYKGLNETEVNTLSKVYNLYGREMALEYLDYLEPHLNLRSKAITEGGAKEFAEKHPFLATAASWATALGKGKGVGYSVSQSLKGKPVDVNNPRFAATHVTDKLQGTVNENYVAPVGETGIYKSLAEVTKYVGIDNIPSFFYNAGNSAINSAVNVLLTKNIGAAGGMSGTALNQFTSSATSILMGSQVAQDGVLDAKSRGLSDENAITLGIIRGLIEGVTEKYSLDAILGNPNSVLFKNIKSGYSKSFIAEGSEETASNWLNRIADAIYYGEDNDIKANYDKYLKKGMSAADALAYTIYDLFKEDASSFLAGGISGVSMYAVHNLKAANPKKIGKMIASKDAEGEVVKIGLAMEQNSESYKKALEISKSGDYNLKDIGELALSIISENNYESAEKLREKIIDRVEELGGDFNEARQIANAISNAYANNKMDLNFVSTVTSNNIAQQVIDEITVAQPNTWAYEIKTEIENSQLNSNRVRELASTKGIDSEILNFSQKQNKVEQSSTPTAEAENVGVVETDTADLQVDGEQGLGFTEPTDQEIYRDPTDEENAEAIFGKRKNAKQRHIIDVAKKLDSDIKVVFVPKDSKALNGKNGKFNRNSKTIYIAEDLKTTEMYAEVFKHEFVHRLELRKAYDSFKNYLFNKSEAFEDYAKARLYYRDKVDVELTRDEAINSLIDMYVENTKGDLDLTREQAEREAVADFVARTLFKDKSADFIQTIKNKDIYNEKGTGFAQLETDLALFEEIARTDRTLRQKIIDAIRDLIASIKGMPNLEKDLRYIEERLIRVYESADKTNGVESGEVYKTANVSAETVQSLNEEGLEYDVDSESLYSADSWESSEYVKDRKGTAKKISEAIGVSERKALQYIKDIDSIANKILSNYARLGYVPSPDRSAFVSNAEYGGSIDMSTLCAKRRWLTGTFSAIQRALKNTALTANEILEIRNMLKEKGIEVSCGLCYVEGSRAQMGRFAKEFIERYKKRNPDWVPDMADINTPEGAEQMRMEHPEAYEAYETFWNNKGVLNEGEKVLFASQQKPKLYQLRTDYKHEILDKFSSEGNVVEKNKNGGLRIQSFSDFEIVHLIDMMQVIIDMSRVGLNGQAYTKVPEFALALGNTGLKINLSLIAKDVDAEGNLVFDDVEGMPFETAMNIRNMYSKNVGTVLVVFNDAQLIAALKDSRIDFVLPFHRSQWKKAMYEQLGLPANTKDYTYVQNEKYIKPVYYTTRKGTISKKKATNYMPNQYWDFDISGKENAEKYLKMCAEENKRPKFYKFLDDNGDGSYSLKKDGSTDGYWKLLIDFKMYDNEGKGSKQTAVKPDFNMEECHKMLDEYQGEHQKFPVDQEVVDEFVSNYAKKHGEQGFKETVKAETKAPATKYDLSLQDESFSSDDLSGNLDKDLRAIHNITSQQLIEALKQKKIIAPSLAITNKPFNDFGEISLVFDKRTIDPETYQENELFGADAWTPSQLLTRKNIRFDSNKVAKVVNDIKEQIGSKFATALFDVNPKQFKEDVIKSHGSVYFAYNENIGIKTAYALESGIISKIPTKNGSIDIDVLNDAIDSELDTDGGWRKYKKWLNQISEDIVFDYDAASDEEILNSMKAQPNTAKPFRLTEDGALTVPAAKYNSVEELRKIKHRLSENAKLDTEKVAKKMLSFAKKTAAKNETSTKAAVDAINNTYEHRYNIKEIRNSFEKNGIELTYREAQELQSLYKEAVELSQPYFEGKAMREVGIDEISYAVIPSDTSAGIKKMLEENGIEYIEHEAGNVKSRTNAVNSRTDVAFSSDDLTALQRDLHERHKNGEITNEEYLEEMDKLWEKANEEYGSLPQGENAQLNMPVPQKVAEDKPTERFARTIIETDSLNGDMLKGIEERVLLGGFSYKVISDKSAMKKADKAVENKTASATWEDTVNNSKRINKNQIAIGEKLLENAIKNGNTFEVLKLSAELADVFTRAGQVVQAARLLKKMTGAGRLVSLQRTVRTLNKDLREKYGVDYPPIKISEESARRLAEANTAGGIEYAYQNILQEVADQMPATFLDKWNAWRYFAMLSNPKTHIRNVVGNAIFLPAVRIKDFLAVIGELGLEQDKKTKSIAFKKDAYSDFAKNDNKRKDVQNLLKGNKYNDKSAINEKQKIFKSKLLNFLTEFNSNALEFEDLIFKNIHYKHALAGYLRARKVDLNNINQDVLDEARIYAVEEAKKATFNDMSALANAIQRLSNSHWGWDLAIGSVLPFKRTPINIVKRGIEYSPIGMGKTLIKGIYDVKKGKFTMSEFIDGLASGLTGTGIMLAGMWLACSGAVLGGEDDDDESKFEKLLGKQEYAIKIGDKSYTVDWAAPANIPFFIGVEIANIKQNEENFNFANFSNITWNALEPITNLSMLSGMQSVIESARYAGAGQVISSIAADALTSYGMQGIPSLLGATARTVDPKQRSWYIDKNDKWLDSTAQTIKNNIQSKIPGLTKTQIPKIDMWGREVSRGGTGERILENFVSPGYYSKVEYDETSEELKRIFKETDVDVFPSLAEKSFAVDKKTKHLTADEYVTFAKAKGSYSFDYLKEFMESSQYKKLTDAERADVITGLYEYANAKAKTTVSDYDLMKGYKTVTRWEQNGRSAVDYYISRAISK